MPIVPAHLDVASLCGENSASPGWLPDVLRQFANSHTFAYPHDPTLRNPHRGPRAERPKSGDGEDRYALSQAGR